MPQRQQAHYAGNGVSAVLEQQAERNSSEIPLQTAMAAIHLTARAIPFGMAQFYSQNVIDNDSFMLYNQYVLQEVFVSPKVYTFQGVQPM